MSYELENLLKGLVRELYDMQARDRMFSRDWYYLHKKMRIVSRALKRMKKIEKRMGVGV